MLIINLEKLLCISIYPSTNFSKVLGDIYEVFVLIYFATLFLMALCYKDKGVAMHVLAESTEFSLGVVCVFSLLLYYSLSRSGYSTQ